MQLVNDIKSRWRDQYFGLIFSLALLMLVLSGWQTCRAQLFSPGKLTQSHANIEGLDNCTQCHELGESGIVNSRCLGCHQPLKKLIDEKRGLHARVIDQSCSDCHKEHFGRDFDAIHMDTTSFRPEHFDKTGFKLVGKHVNVGCRSCHTPENIVDDSVRAFKKRAGKLAHTFLGLSDNCVNCHQADNPHGKQFVGQFCSNCHTPENWDDLSLFDHSQSRFALVGKHIKVDCGSCHKPESSRPGAMVQYTGLAFGSCNDCHEDVHHGTMGSNCSSCHREDGWHLLKNFRTDEFDHSTTGFPLQGAHASVNCTSCHDPNSSISGINIKYKVATLDRSYPSPAVTNCMSCHEDYHEGVFSDLKGGSDCKGCHTEENWLPSTFGPDRHNREADFALTGAHVALPCFSCHRQDGNPTAALNFEMKHGRCEDCHDQDNIHGSPIARDAALDLKCEDCHETESWTALKAFNHSRTSFKLTGRHVETSCVSCHRDAGSEKLHMAFAEAAECSGCHEKDDPHHNQFAQSAMGSNCDACHDTQTFRIASFDHSKTKFPLKGAHEGVSCASCHPKERAPDGQTFTRFRPISSKCEDCHDSSNR